MYIQTSQDILFLTIATSVAVLTVLIGWLITYIVLIVKQGFDVTKKINTQVDKISDVIDSLKRKIEHHTAYLSLIVEGVKKMTDYLSERKVTQKKSTKKSV